MGAKLREILSWITAAVAVTVLGSIIGHFIAVRVSNFSSSDRAGARKRLSETVLTEMKTLQVGDRLTDHVVASFNGERILLSEKIDKTCLVSFIDVNCGTCWEELEYIMTTVGDKEALSRVLFVSTNHESIVADQIRGSHLESLVYFDEDRLWTRQLNITVFPFNLVVNKSLEIEEIFVGSFSSSDLERLNNSQP